MLFRGRGFLRGTTLLDPEDKRSPGERSNESGDEWHRFGAARQLHLKERISTIAVIANAAAKACHHARDRTPATIAITIRIGSTIFTAVRIKMFMCEPQRLQPQRATFNVLYLFWYLLWALWPFLLKHDAIALAHDHR